MSAEADGCQAGVGEKAFPYYHILHSQLFPGRSCSLKKNMLFFGTDQKEGSLDTGILMEPVDVGKYEFIRMPHKEKWGNW